MCHMWCQNIEKKDAGDNQDIAFLVDKYSLISNLLGTKMPTYHLVGDPFDEEERPSVFELRVMDHLIDIDPLSHKITTEISQIDPRSYFITSGDALAKAKQLEKDLWALAGKLKSSTPKRPTKKYLAYASDVWKCAGKCRSLVNKLQVVKGVNCFLETEWSADRQLLCIPKNPRIKHNI
jgi:hypothetical protein